MSTTLSPHPETSRDPEDLSRLVELVLQLQVSVLKKERFVSVLGADAVDSCHLDWEKVSRPDAAFDDSQKLIATRRLKTVLFARMHRESWHSTDREFENLFLDVAKLRGFIEMIHIERLERVAVNFFQCLFPNSTLIFSPKLSGVQMGLKASVTLGTGEMRRYHVKTHTLGLLASGSTFAKPVNPHELMVYKILERLGFGCETFFMQRSLHDVYIATLDAGHGGSFRTFDRAVGEYGRDNDQDYGSTIWGVLQNNHEDPRLNDAITVEAAIESDPIAHNFLEQIAAVDMITRILRVHDLFNNTQNFGFLVSPGELPALKMIDFRISNDFRLCYEHFGGFLAGNGLYDYIYSHRTLRYCLHDRPVSKRVDTALHCLSQGLLCHFHQCIDQAYEDVLKYLSEANEFAESFDPFSNDLALFQVALHMNIDMFTERLERQKASQST